MYSYLTRYTLFVPIHLGLIDYVVSHWKDLRTQLAYLTVHEHFMWTWWRHQMKTFSALLALCAGNSPVTGEFPAQRPVTRIFDVFLYLHLSKRLGKQSWGWWFETLSSPLWRHCNVVRVCIPKYMSVLLYGQFNRIAYNGIRNTEAYE